LAEQSRIVRLPLNKIGSINKINKMYALLEQSNERPPSAEIAKELDMTVNDKRVYETLVVTYQWMRLLLRRRF
jgi:RNA polymerase primary sigma factor